MEGRRRRTAGDPARARAAGSGEPALRRVSSSTPCWPRASARSSRCCWRGDASTARGENVGSTMLLGSVVVENLVSTIAWVAVVVTVGLFLPLSRSVWITTARRRLRLPGDHPRRAASQPRKTHAAVDVDRPAVATGDAGVRAALGRGPRKPPWASRPSSVRGGRPCPASPRGARSWSGIYCALRAFGLDVAGWSGAGPAAGHRHRRPDLPRAARQRRRVPGRGRRPAHPHVSRCRARPRWRSPSDFRPPRSSSASRSVSCS